ncbi:uncharacterized protein LOC116307654 [Actinia tenebrosa]|uniref:Uncharacterized protein LOC116307654 n=1 Tax=Actinia tenebrosa TaxID=6105 RepID=A0A6P8J2H4_ACTTE|nr:uncharacterized protein LOC116307654 [Actinia tenebrosa]
MSSYLKLLSKATTLSLLYHSKTISGKLAVDEEVEYDEIVEDVFETIDGVTNIVVTTFSVALPTIPEFSWFGKRNLARRKSFKLKKVLDPTGKIKLPTKATDESKGLRSWFSKEKKWVHKKVADVRKDISIKFRGAVEKVEKFADMFGISFGYVDSALNFYETIENFKKCKNAYEKAKGAVMEMRKAKNTLDDIYNDAVGAREIMYKARDQLKNNITSEAFLYDLTALKNNMEEIQGTGRGLQDMIDGIDDYIRVIKSTNDFETVTRLISRLHTSLVGFPFVYRCIITKVTFLSSTIRQCKKGKTIEDIIEDTKNMYDVNSTDCQQKLGGGHLTPDIIQRFIDKAAQNDGSFNKDCALNDDSKIEQICTVRCEGKGKNAKEIAKKIPWPAEKIKLVLPKCESCIEGKKSIICMVKRVQPAITDSEIQEEFPMLTLKEIASVECKN